MVARRTCTLNMRPRISVALTNSPSAWAAAGKRTRCGSPPSARSYTAIPQPESCSSDWRISGFSASSSSCLIETGSEATQPNTRHMPTGCYRAMRGRIRPVGGFANHGYQGAGTEQDLVGATGEAVRHGAPGRGREEPPAGAARGGDRLHDGAGRAARGVHDELAPQPGRVRERRAVVASRPGGLGAARGGCPGGAAAAAAPRAAAARGGGDARGP